MASLSSIYIYPSVHFAIMYVCNNCRSLLSPCHRLRISLYPSYHTTPVSQSVSHPTTRAHHGPAASLDIVIRRRGNNVMQCTVERTRAGRRLCGDDCARPDVKVFLESRGAFKKLSSDSVVAATGKLLYIVGCTTFRSHFHTPSTVVVL